MAKLDPGVAVELGHKAAVLVAVRPVRAAEPGAGDADGGAGEDDQRERDERYRRDDEVLLRVESQPGGQGPSRMPDLSA